VSKASTPAIAVVTVVDPLDSSSSNLIGAEAGFVVEAAWATTPVFGLAVAATAFTAPAAATVAAAAATGVVPDAGLTVGKLPTPARGTAAAAPPLGRLGFTVMRAVSLGGAFLITEVPDFLFPSGVNAGLDAAGFMGMTGAAGPGETGEMPVGLTEPGLTGPGEIGFTAPGALAAGVTGSGAPTLGITAEATAAAANGIA